MLRTPLRRLLSVWLRIPITRDGVIKLKSGKVAFITDICGERITAQIVSKRRLNSIFDIPCDSLAVGIGKVRKSTLSDSLECCIMRSDIDRKMVCLPYNDGTEWALIPVHHTYSWSQRVILPWFWVCNHISLTSKFVEL